jgi:3-dehydroquinate synthetase
MLGSMKHDKKVRDQTLHFVLPERIGSVVMRSGIPPATVRSAIRGLTR